MRTGMASFARTMGSVLLPLCLAVPAFAGELKSIELSQGALGTRAEIRLDSVGADGFRTLSLHAPERLVVDLPDTSAAANFKLPDRNGIVQSVRTGKPNADTLRIVFDLSAAVAPPKPSLEPADGGSRLVIEWPGAGSASAGSAPAVASVAAASAASVTGAASQAVVQAPEKIAPEKEDVPAAASPLDILNGSPVALQSPEVAVPKETRKEREAREQAEKAEKAQAAQAAADDTARQQAAARALRAGVRPLIIAIDAGHGGKDTGAIGPTGKYEKNVTLAIARELARQIDATPGLKSYLVRDDDYFIPLPQRAQKARAAHADLFVSIHADSAPNHSASGSSVYVLSLKGATSQRARWLADKENAADLVGGGHLQKVDDTLSSVLIDLTQSGHMKASEACANHVLDHLAQIGNSHTGEIEKANFAVLRTSDMPSMLVETAYISNYTEERQLTTPDYQHKVAGAVLKGVQDYFTRDPPPGTLFAMRAQADAGHYGDAGGAP